MTALARNRQNQEYSEWQSSQQHPFENSNRTRVLEPKMPCCGSYWSLSWRRENGPSWNAPCWFVAVSQRDCWDWYCWYCDWCGYGRPTPPYSSQPPTESEYGSRSSRYSWKNHHSSSGWFHLYLYGRQHDRSRFPCVDSRQTIGVAIDTERHRDVSTTSPGGAEETTTTTRRVVLVTSEDDPPDWKQLLLLLVVVILVVLEVLLVNGRVVVGLLSAVVARITEDPWESTTTMTTCRHSKMSEY